MIKELLQEISNMTMKHQQVTNDITLIQFTIVNVCIVNTPNGWFLIDAGMENAGDYIIEVAEKKFGKGVTPEAIIITHGHFDHIGSIYQLTEHWKDVPVYAHKLEIPYLTGQKDYSQGDPTAGGGMVTLMSPAFPHSAIDISSMLQPLPDNGRIPGMSNWRWIHTPGHSIGHISLFKDSDRVLIAADAFSTVKQESMTSVLSQAKEISGPPAYLTTDWEASKNSIIKLKSLNPSLAITSHGLPMEGKEIERHLNELLQNFDELAMKR